MKRIYLLLLIASIAGASSCELPSNAKYTGNYYSATQRVHKHRNAPVKPATTSDMAMTPVAKIVRN